MRRHTIIIIQSGSPLCDAVIVNDGYSSNTVKYALSCELPSELLAKHVYHPSSSWVTLSIRKSSGLSISFCRRCELLKNLEFFF